MRLRPSTVLLVVPVLLLSTPTRAEETPLLLYRSPAGEVTLVSTVDFLEPGGPRGRSFLILPGTGRPVEITAQLGGDPVEFAVYGRESGRLLVRTPRFTPKDLRSGFYVTETLNPPDFKPAWPDTARVCFNGRTGPDEFIYVTREGTFRVFLVSLRGPEPAQVEQIYESASEVAFLSRGATDSFRLGVLTLEGSKPVLERSPLGSGLRVLARKERSDVEFVRELQVWNEDGVWKSAPTGKGFRGWYPFAVMGTEAMGTEVAGLEPQRGMLYDEITGKYYYSEMSREGRLCRVDLEKREWVYTEVAQGTVEVRRVPMKGGSEVRTVFPLGGEPTCYMLGEDGSVLLLVTPKLYRIDRGMNLSLIAELPLKAD